MDQEGAINFRYKIIGETLFLTFLPTTPSSRFQTTEEIFELTSRPLGSLNLASCVASRNMYREKDIVKCVLLLGVQVPLQYIVTSRPSDITLDCVFVKNTLNLIDKKNGGAP